MTRMMNRKYTKAATVLGLGAMALATTGALVAGEPKGPIQLPADAAASLIPDLGYADLVEAVLPAVVNVRVSGEAKSQKLASRPDLSPDMQEFFERFFGSPWPHQAPGESNKPRRHVSGEGSGFFIDDKGHIVTNAHVVGTAEKIEIVTQDGTVHQARLQGIDEKTDLAVLSIDAQQPTPFVVFADSNEVRVGERVVAVGNPFGLGGTVTSGIVSATGRELGAGPYDDFMQIDASINRGNSGGPTFNLHGEVVGVNSMIFSPSGGSVGIGFAIAANLARDVVNDLLDDGSIERGWLGVTIQPIDEDLAVALNVDKDGGVLVSSVLPGSPADTAGILSGDVILSIDAKQVSKVRDVTRQVAALDPGEDAKLTLLRDGSETVLDVMIGEMPNTKQIASLDAEEQSDQPKIGLRLRTLAEREKAQAGVEEGVLVSEVDYGSPAYEKGIRAGDIIVAVDGSAVTTPDEVKTAIQSSLGEGDKALLVQLQRNRTSMFVAVPMAVS